MAAHLKISVHDWTWLGMEIGDAAMKKKSIIVIEIHYFSSFVMSVRSLLTFWLEKLVYFFVSIHWWRKIANNSSQQNFSVENKTYLFLNVNVYKKITCYAISCFYFLFCFSVKKVKTKIESRYLFKTAACSSPDYLESVKIKLRSRYCHTRQTKSNCLILLGSAHNFFYTM